MFLIKMYRTSPVRARRIQEITRSLLEPQGRWNNILRKSASIQEALDALDANARAAFLHQDHAPELVAGDVDQDILHAAEHSNLNGLQTESTNSSSPVPATSKNPFMAQASAEGMNRNPFQASASNGHRSAGAQHAAYPAAHSPNSQRYYASSPKGKCGEQLFSTAMSATADTSIPVANKNPFIQSGQRGLQPPANPFARPLQPGQPTAPANPFAKPAQPSQPASNTGTNPFRK